MTIHNIFFLAKLTGYVSEASKKKKKKKNEKEKEKLNMGLI